MSTMTMPAPAMARLTSKKKRSNTSCDCEASPVRVPFVLPDMEGEKCAICFQVLNWRKRSVDKKTKKTLGPIRSAYEILRVEPVKDMKDHIEVVCRFDVDQGFGVPVLSTVDKVAKALANPMSLQGKMILLEFTELNKEGFPKNPTMVCVKSREEMDVYLKQQSQ